MGFAQLLTATRGRKLFEDPLRNGTLLVALLQRLEIGHIEKFYANPHSIEECTFNIEAALTLLRSQKNQLGVPLYLLQKVEEVVRGEHEAVWGIYYFLMKGIAKVDFSTSVSNRIVEKAPVEVQ
jgi:hypothetical protein